MSEVIEPVVKARNKRHDVHLYVITRVKVCNVKAPTPAMAAAKAEDMVMGHLHDILDGHVMHSLDSDAYVEHTEYAEDGCKYFCVDPYKGKEIDYASVQWLDRNYRPMADKEQREARLESMLKCMAETEIPSDPTHMAALLQIYQKSAQQLIREEG